MEVVPIIVVMKRSEGARWAIGAQVLFGASLFVGAWLRFGPLVALVVGFMGVSLALGAGAVFVARDRHRHRADDADWILAGPAQRVAPDGSRAPGRMYVNAGIIEWRAAKVGSLRDATFSESNLQSVRVQAMPLWSSVVLLSTQDGVEKLNAAITANRVTRALHAAGVPTAE